MLPILNFITYFVICAPQANIVRHLYIVVNTLIYQALERVFGRCIKRDVLILPSNTLLSA